MYQGFGVMPNTKGSKARATDEIRSAGLGIKLWPSLKEALDQAAADDGRTTSQYVERLIVQRLREEGRWPK